MINVHLNGDVVRCPDIANILARDREFKDKHNVCRYNIHESDCETWKVNITAWQKWNEIKPRCMLAGCDNCPGHRLRADLGNKEKTFKIDNVTYRKLASTSHYMVKESKSKTLFLTLTFGTFKKHIYNNYILATEAEKKQIEHEVNQAFSNFVDNLNKNYGCGGYVAVREFGSINRRLHFHILCSIPYYPFAKLNAAWCAAASDIAEFSKNALTSDPKTRFVNNPVRAMRYVCKYFSKAKGQRSSTRLVFVSNNILQKPKNYPDSLESLLDSFKFDYMKQTSDYTTCYRISDTSELNRFFETFVYPFFELSAKKSTGLYAFPGNTS